MYVIFLGKCTILFCDLGCIALPSQRTLRDYTHFIQSLTGFSVGVDKYLMEVVKANTLEEFQKCIALVLDKMHVKEDLVFSKHSGSLIGFVNLGNINDLLLRYESSLESKSSATSPNLAKFILAFMVRGLFTPLQFPYA